MAMRRKVGRGLRGIGAWIGGKGGKSATAKVAAQAAPKLAARAGLSMFGGPVGWAVGALTLYQLLEAFGVDPIAYLTGSEEAEKGQRLTEQAIEAGRRRDEAALIGAERTRGRRERRRAEMTSSAPLRRLTRTAARVGGVVDPGEDLLGQLAEMEAQAGLAESPSIQQTVDWLRATGMDRRVRSEAMEPRTLIDRMRDQR